MTRTKTQITPTMIHVGAALPAKARGAGAPSKWDDVFHALIDDPNTWYAIASDATAARINQIAGGLRTRAKAKGLAMTFSVRTSDDEATLYGRFNNE
jgi:hypothetical protein